MEIDELKTVWAKYDKKLTENLKLNGELLRKMNLDKSKREMNTPLNSEIMGVVIGGIFLAFFLSATLRFSGEFKFFISGILTNAICIIITALSIKKIKLLSSIDYYNSSIVDLQKSILNFKRILIQYKKVELIGGFFLAIVMSPILVKALRNVDVYTNPWRYAGAAIFALIVGYPIGIWMYKNWYEKKIQNTEQFLKEIEKFEKED